MKNHNLSIENAILFENVKYKNKNNKAIEYTVFEKTENEFTGNRKDISKHFNINYNYIIRNTKNIDINNKKDIINKIEEIIINYNNIYNSKYIHKNIKKYTVFKGISKNNPIIDEINNKEYYEFTGTLDEICYYFEVKYNTIYKRMSRYNITFEDAINYENNRNHKKYIIFKSNKLNHKEFIGNKTQICKHFNINLNFLNSYIEKHKNISISEAVENIIIERENKIKNIYNIDNYTPNIKDENGKKYIIFRNNNNNNNSNDEYNFEMFIGTKKQIANKYNIDYRNLLKNIKKYNSNNKHNNKTIEDIIEETIIRIYRIRNNRNI